VPPTLNTASEPLLAVTLFKSIHASASTGATTVVVTQVAP
jgi:hypothetical protein